MGGGYLVGQDRAPGWLKVGGWLVKDPQSRGESIAARRARLGKAGDDALSTSTIACPSPDVAGPCRNGQVEGVVWGDVEVARKPRFKRVRLRSATPVAPTGRPQRNVSLAASGSTVFAAYEQAGSVMVARSRDGGATWGRATKVAKGWWPSVSAGTDGKLWLAWQSANARAPRSFVAVAGKDGRFGRPVTIGSSRAWRPSIAATGTTAYVAWIDERERSADDDLPQAHVFGTRLRANGSPRGDAVRLDQGAPAPLAAKLDNAWAPDVAASGTRVAVTWIDFRTYDWRAYLRTSRDGGTSFGAEAPVTDAPSGDSDESLDDSPRAVLDAKGDASVVFTDYRKRDGSKKPSPLYDIHLGRPGAKNVQVDPWGDRQLDTFAPAAAFSGSRVYVAWQDASRGINDIRLRRVGGPTARVSDNPRANAWRPDLVAVPGGRLLVAWEDESFGPSQIFAARVAAR